MDGWNPASYATTMSERTANSQQAMDHEDYPDFAGILPHGIGMQPSMVKMTLGCLKYMSPQYADSSVSPFGSGYANQSSGVSALQTHVPQENGFVSESHGNRRIACPPQRRVGASVPPYNAPWASGYNQSEPYNLHGMSFPAESSVRSTGNTAPTMLLDESNIDPLLLAMNSATPKMASYRGPGASRSGEGLPTLIQTPMNQNARRTEPHEAYPYAVDASVHRFHDPHPGHTPPLTANVAPNAVPNYPVDPIQHGPDAQRQSLGSSYVGGLTPTEMILQHEWPALERDPESFRILMEIQHQEGQGAGYFMKGTEAGELPIMRDHWVQLLNRLPHLLKYAPETVRQALELEVRLLHPDGVPPLDNQNPRQQDVDKGAIESVAPAPEASHKRKREGSKKVQQAKTPENLGGALKATAAPVRALRKPRTRRRDQGGKTAVTPALNNAKNPAAATLVPSGSASGYGESPNLGTGNNLKIVNQNINEDGEADGDGRTATQVTSGKTGRRNGTTEGKGRSRKRRKTDAKTKASAPSVNVAGATGARNTQTHSARGYAQWSQGRIAEWMRTHPNEQLPRQALDADFHELISHCTPPEVDIRHLGNHDVTAAELLTYFPLHTIWRRVLWRLRSNGWSTKNIVQFVLWSRNIQDNKALKETTVTKQYTNPSNNQCATYWAQKQTPPLTNGPYLHFDFSDRDDARGKHGQDAVLQDYRLIDLAEGVHHHPDGDDARVLTRAIKLALFKQDPALLSELDQFVHNNWKDLDMDNLPPMTTPTNPNPDEEAAGRFNIDNHNGSAITWRQSPTNVYKFGLDGGLIEGMDRS